MNEGPRADGAPFGDALSIAVESRPGEDVAALFARRFGHPLPDFPHHVVARVARDGASLPLCYIHFTEHAGVLLGGGACIDDRLLRRLDAGTRRALKAAGGPYQASLRWAVAHFAPRFPAIFGYCGDALAERADRAVGFEPTGHPHLLAYFTRPLDRAERERLVAIAHAVGPF
jgi:hypothetical protein